MAIGNEAKPGALIISLDFELMWGMFDKVTKESYGANLTGVHTVAPKLLTLFAEHDIHVTWATVGILMHENTNELASTLPAERDEPPYVDPILSAYEHLRTHELDADALLYFAPALVAQIVAAPHQELASHTYAHYYCKEALKGGKKSQAFFAADCRAFLNTIRHFDTTATSIVFPRNQWTNEALTTLASFGFTSFRGTEAHFLYRARTEKEQQNKLVRGLRLLDHYLNISGHHTYTLTKNQIHSVSGLINLPASRFLRPWSKTLSFLEPLRLRRIKKSMTYAAKRGEVFHLWWHPHNFGVNQVENLATLTAILEHFTYLQKMYDMESLTMKEAATRVRESHAPNASVT